MAQWPMSLWALLGTGLTFAMTAAGSAMVFFFRNEMKGKVQSCFLGFAGGIMMAASVWSLLIPSIEETIMRGQIGWIPAAGGFFFGGGFLYALETGVLKYRKKKNKTHEVSMLLFAVTLHNIPEGMAVGIAFAMAGITENSSIELDFFYGYGICDCSSHWHRDTKFSRGSSCFHSFKAERVKPMECFF